MPFAQINCFNHTDPTNHTTSQADLPKLNNEFWDTSKKDRIISSCPTKRRDLKPTENTKYGRSELRQMDPKTGKKTAIRIDEFEFNYIAARQCIIDLGPDGKAIGIQWHGSSTRPLVKGQWLYDKATDSYSLNIQLAETFQGDDDGFVLVSGVKRYQIFDVLVGFSKNQFVAAYNWMTPQAIIETRTINKDGSYSKDKGLYSKAGIYCQTDIKLPFEKMKEGCGKMAMFELSVYSGPKLDLKAINLDFSAFWRVGETFSLEAEERKALPPHTPTSTLPAKPTTPVPPAAGDTSAPSPATPASDDLEAFEALFKDVPVKAQASLRKLVSQIKGNLTANAKKTAKENLTKLEDQIDVLGDSEGVKLRAWCNEQRAAVK